MATFRKFIYVNSDGDFQEHDVANDQLQLHSVKLGALATAPAINGLSLLGDIDLNLSARVRNAQDPQYADELVNKRYADALASGLHPKFDVRVATTGVTDLAGYTYVAANDDNTTALALAWTGVTTAPEIDDITLADGDRLLIKDAAALGAANAGNGIFTYDATAQGFRRAEDSDNVSILSNSEVKGGLFVFVQEGTANSSKGFIMKTPETIATLGTSPIAFATFTSPGPIEVDELFLSRIGNVIHFEFLDEQNILIGNAADHPAMYDTSGTGASMIAGNSGGRNQIEASTLSGMVIKAGVIKDDQVETTANIKTSKSQVDAGFAPAAPTTSPVSITGTDTALVALQKLQQNFNALASVATTGNEVGAHLVALPNNIVGFSAAVNDVADALNELAGVDKVIENAEIITIGDLVYVNATGNIQRYTDITATLRPIGIAASSKVGNGADTCKVITTGKVINGLTGADLAPGTRYFWNPDQGAGRTGWTSNAGDFSSGEYVWQIAVADGLHTAFVQLDFSKKQA